MNNLATHNTAELPLIAQMYNNELHLMREAFQDIDEQDSDVQWALCERMIDLTIQESPNMAALVDTINQQPKALLVMTKQDIILYKIHLASLILTALACIIYEYAA